MVFSIARKWRHVAELRFQEKQGEAVNVQKINDRPLNRVAIYFADFSRLLR